MEIILKPSVVVLSIKHICFWNIVACTDWQLDWSQCPAPMKEKAHLKKPETGHPFQDEELQSLLQCI